MQCRPEKDQAGKVLRYRYRYYDNKGKLRTVAQKDLPYRPKNKAQAEALRKQLEAIYEKAKAEVRLSESWHEKYYDYAALYEMYAIYRKRKAKSCYKDKLSYFRNYVLKFFLEIAGLDNLNQWGSAQESFFEWVIEREKIKGEGFLSNQTINHIITEYNVFMGYMKKKGKVREKFEMEPLPKSELTERGPEWVIQHEEKEVIFKRLKTINDMSADIFLLMMNTGLRINELLSLDVNAMKKGEIPHKQLAVLVKAAFEDKELLSYILLEKQLDRDTDEPKPLKARAKIKLKDARYVPIFDATIYNILVKYIKAAKERDDEYLFYCIYPYQKLNHDLKKAYKGTKFLKKTSHACRHSFSTFLGEYDLTGVLGRIILGHDEKTSKKYNHVHEQLMAQLKNKENEVDEWEFIEEKLS